MLWLALLTLQNPVADTLRDPLLNGASVGAYAVDEAGKVLLDHNSDLRLVPASNQKILTCTYALNVLGPDYRPVTKFWNLKDRTVIDAPGDPTLTFDQLKQAVQRVDRQKPVWLRQAYGPLLNDTWAYGDLPNRYSAQVTAFCFDQAAFAMWSENGRPVLLPGSFGVKTTYLPSKAPPQVVYDPIRRTATVSGQLPPGKVLLDTLALPSPDLDAASLFSKTVRRTSIVPTTSPTFTIQGKPIREAIADCLKPSDNLIAENLLMMAASRQGPWLKTPYSDADDRLSTLLTKTVGIPSHSISPEDGSGLSRRNIVTAKTLVQVLNWQKNQPTAEIFRNALARPNEKGTLRTRLQGIQFEGKTGSLFMVSALSGYITSSNGRKATVSILLNHFTCTADEARALMDRIVRSLASKLEEPSDSARFTGLLQD